MHRDPPTPPTTRADRADAGIVVECALIYAAGPDHEGVVGHEPPLWRHGPAPDGPFALGPSDTALPLDGGTPAERWLIIRAPASAANGDRAGASDRGERHASPSPDDPTGASAHDRAALTNIRLFGRIEVQGPHGIAVVPRGRSAQILAALAAACPDPLSLAEFERSAWSDAEPPSANAVYTAMSRVRRVLASVGADPIVTDGHGYRLDVDPRVIDLVRFGQAATAVRTADPTIGPAEHRSAIEAALGLWAGTPLPGVSGAMIDRWRHRLVEHRAALADALAVALLTSGDAAGAEQIGWQLLADHPSRETTWVIVVIATYRTSRIAVALDVLRSATDGLRDRLGLDPGPALAGLEIMLLTHDRRLLDDEWLRAVVGGDPRALG